MRGDTNQCPTEVEKGAEKAAEATTVEGPPHPRVPRSPRLRIPPGSNYLGTRNLSHIIGSRNYAAVAVNYTGDAITSHSPTGCVKCGCARVGT
jgi:hypothetical protein